MKSLLDIVYTYSWVRLLWGNLIFFGRLKDLKINYTLFKPSGEPLRARLDLTFSSAMSPQQEALRANRSSPDLSHQITVREGDTLPLHNFFLLGVGGGDVRRQAVSADQRRDDVAVLLIDVVEGSAASKESEGLAPPGNDQPVHRSVPEESPPAAPVLRD